jgi:hypothetical protein
MYESSLSVISYICINCELFTMQHIQITYHHFTDKNGPNVSTRYHFYNFLLTEQSLIDWKHKLQM